MEFKILGTGSASPLLTRNPSAFVVSIDNESILIDCGEATQYRLLEYKIKTSRIKYILISHLHGDHYFGLIGLISSQNLYNRTEPLTIVGPKGLDEIITLQLKHSNSQINYKLNFIETDSDSFQELIIESNFTIFTIPLQHRIPCTGFIIKKHAGLRKILGHKIPVNFPIELFHDLKLGKNVTDIKTGKTYNYKDFTEPGEPEKNIGYASDTIFDESIIMYLENCDLLYHEATFTTEHQQRAGATFHSTSHQAAIIAKQAKVKKLIIGHFSSRYKDLSVLLEEAKAEFSETYLSKEGDFYII